MFATRKKTLIAVCAVAASAPGGAAFAGAATSTTPSSTSSASTTEQRDQRPARQALTGDAADKVTAAAKAKVSGGTVLRAEAGGPYSTPYHAHVRKSDGSEVVVLVNSSFEATSVQNRPAGRGGPGRGGRGHHGPGGRGGETALTGATSDKVTAAARAKVPGGTVLRVENDADSSSPYEAHVRRSDGTEVVVLVNKDFEATSVKEFNRP